MATITLADTTVFSFDTLDRVDPPSKRVAPVTRPNVDGVGLQEFGTRGATMTLRGVVSLEMATPTATTIKAQLVAYKAAAGAMATVVDDHGMSWPLVAIQAVTIPPRANGHANPQALVASVGGVDGTDATHKFTVNFLAVDTN